MICPIRKGGPCVGERCAWYNETECSILSIAKTKTQYISASLAAYDKNFRDNGAPDDDVPF